MTPEVATWHSRCVASMLQDVADMKKEITDEDLLALITDEINQPPQLWALVDLQVGCSARTRVLPHICSSGQGGSHGQKGQS